MNLNSICHVGLNEIDAKVQIQVHKVRMVTLKKQWKFSMRRSDSKGGGGVDGDDLMSNLKSTQKCPYKKV